VAVYRQVQGMLLLSLSSLPHYSLP